VQSPAQALVPQTSQPIGWQCCRQFVETQGFVRSQGAAGAAQSLAAETMGTTGSDSTRESKILDITGLREKVRSNRSRQIGGRGGWIRTHTGTLQAKQAVCGRKVSPRRHFPFGISTSGVRRVKVPHPPADRKLDKNRRFRPTSTPSARTALGRHCLESGSELPNR
jgi:hypothetical protein